jgi:hypothetical protein
VGELTSVEICAATGGQALDLEQAGFATGMPKLNSVDPVEPVSGFEPLTCRLQDGCSAN